MGCCYNALPIDFNDAMANTHTSSLCYTSSHKATDLEGRGQIYHGIGKEQRLLITHFCLQAMNQHLRTDLQQQILRCNQLLTQKKNLLVTMS